MRRWLRVMGFCTNFSLGGARTYPNDVDRDGVADQCSLLFTRREAVARQNALEKAFAGHDTPTHWNTNNPGCSVL